MYQFQKYIAVFLLLLLGRVLIPETIVIDLHAHDHTEDVQKKTDNGFKLDQKHTHCQTDDFLNTPYSPASVTKIKTPVLSFAVNFLASHSCLWKFTFPNNTELRGPPVV